MTTRRDVLKSAAAGGFAVAISNSTTATAANQKLATSDVSPLKPPVNRKIQVAFMVGRGANVMDTAGPWEVFQDVGIDRQGNWAENGERAFSLYTVGETRDRVIMTGGMLVQPNYSVDDAPPPELIVIPALIRDVPKSIKWLKTVGTKTDVTMSVCTGAFRLAEAGLAKDKTVTTHHMYWDLFARQFPELDLIRGQRFIDNGQIATAGGLTSGIDMALHVVERYFGRKIAAATASYMEYESERWVT